jgi:DNA repair protein RecO (recombination protein O)
MCADDRRIASSELSAESRKIAAEMFRTPIGKIAGEPWPKQCGADLRKFLMQIVERHIEKKLVTTTMLERL